MGGLDHGTTVAPTASGAEGVHAGHAEPGAAEHGGHGQHGGHGGHGDQGDHVATFRRRFWWSLLLSLPVVVTAHMIQDWFGYHLDFPGDGLVGPCSGRSPSFTAAGRR